MSSPFPIKIHKTALRNTRNGSDKEYHLVRIVCENGNMMLIKRWGKTATWGQMDVLTGVGTADARDRLYREKTNKGYELTNDAVLTAKTLEELKEHLPGYWTKLAGDQRDFLVAGSSTGGERAGAPKPEPRRPAPEPPPPPTESERYAGNPRWGAFS